MTTITLIGAGGKMGCRITDRLKDTDYHMLYVEVGAAGIANLATRGLTPTPSADALSQADVAIFAVPDNLIERISAEAVPLLKAGAMVICLDPAAPLAGKVRQRDDLSYFVTHPCHPPVFSPENDPEARRDFFGGIKARQSIVSALMQGDEADYERGETIAKTMYGPIINAHRVTVEQMAILEPGLSETTSQTCIRTIREGMDEAIRRGVPAAAARDFILGHIHIQLAIFFEELDIRFSEGAIKAMDRARHQIIQPDWIRVFEPEEIRASLEEITRAPETEVR